MTKPAVPTASLPPAVEEAPAGAGWHRGVLGPAEVLGQHELAELADALNELPRLREALAQFRNAHLDNRLDERTRIGL